MEKGLVQRLLFLSTITAMVVILFMIVCSENGVNDWQRLNRNLVEIKAKNKDLELENLELARNIERLKKDITYIEHVARHELGMTAKNEVVFRFKERRR